MGAIQRVRNRFLAMESTSKAYDCRDEILEICSVIDSLERRVREVEDAVDRLIGLSDYHIPFKVRRD